MAKSGSGYIPFLFSQPADCPMKYERVSELPKNRILTCVIMVDHTHGLHVERERGAEGEKSDKERERKVKERKRKRLSLIHI